MKPFCYKLFKAVSALLLCAALLLCIPAPAQAAYYSSISVNAGQSQRLVFDMDDFGVTLAINNDDSAVSSNPSVVKVTDSWCNDYDNKVYIEIDPLQEGTATVSYSFKVFDYDHWEGMKLSITVHVHKHNYIKVLDTPATTCVNGRYLHACYGCGDSYYTTIYAPHAYGDAVVTKKPTADANGTLTKTCSLCGKLETSAINKSHAVHINTQPASAYAKVGSKATVSVSAGGDGLKYQWYFKNYGASSFGKSSVKSNTYAVTMNEANTGRQVYCEITDQYGNKVKSNTVTLYSSALIKTQPQSTSAYRDDKASVSVGAVGQGLTYEWYIKSSTGKTFSKSSVTSKSYGFVMDDDRNGRQAYCIVKDKHGNSVRSQTVTFTMKPDRPVFITQQPVSVKVFEGEKAAVSVKATGKDMTYQWYFKNPGAAAFSKTSTFKGNSYSVAMDGSRDGRQVYCVITDAYGNKTQSNTVTLSMKHTAKITSQPKNASAVNGAKVSATVKATGDGLKYQWYIKSASGATFSKSSVTSKTYSTTMSEAVNGRKAYCVITDQYGNSVTTNTVTLSRANKITITKQPASVTVNDGSKATVSFQAEGAGLTYEWYFKNSGATAFSKTTSFKGTSYSVSMSPDRHGRQVYCLITDQYGTTQKTATVTLGMNHPITISKQPAGSSVNYGETASVSVAAKGYGLTYQWYVKNVGESKFSKSSTTGSTYAVKMNESRNGRQIFCRITDQFGGTKDTATVTLSMKNQIKITKQPSDFTGVLNQPAQVSVSAEGEGLTYLWYFKEKDGSAFSKSSVTSKSYAVKMNGKRDGRQVYCKITDQYGLQVTTQTVTLHFDHSAPITIQKQPQDTELVGNGTVVSVSVSATGHDLTYRWYYQNRDSDTYQLSDVMSATYSIEMTTERSHQSVYCVITDAFGNTLTSNPAILKGPGVIKITLQPKDRSAMVNGLVSYEVQAIGHDLTYQWFIKLPASDTFTDTGCTSNVYSLRVPSKAYFGSRIKCVITDSSGYSISTYEAPLNQWWP